jgi:ADP-heptose:LPS heptosyltransferase
MTVPEGAWREAPPHRVAVLRALMLGDLLCAVPALRAMKRGWPDAELTLIGLPWARELAARLSCIDRFIEFPGFPGLPERPADIAAVPGFLQQMQAQRLDLLVQLHGSGRLTNPLVAACGAVHSAGFVEPGGYCAEPALYRPWPTEGHEIERLLRLTDHLGLPRAGVHLEFPLRDEDRAALASVRPGVRQPYACMHVGSQLPSRRWWPERFAQVADRLTTDGLQVVLTGTPGEAELVERVRQAMQPQARKLTVDLAGRTNLWTLGALIEGAQLLVCNDTGVSHIAAALGTRSVVVSCGGDVARWAPLDADRHRLLSHDLPCRPCSHVQCPTGHECAAAVSVDEVLAALPSQRTTREAAAETGNV